MDLPVKIQASTITTVKTIASFSVRVQQLELFKSVSVIALLFDDNRNIVETKYITISGEDYLGWNNDDKYILNYVANYCGLTLAPPESS